MAKPLGMAKTVYKRRDCETSKIPKLRKTFDWLRGLVVPLTFDKAAKHGCDSDRSCT